MVADIPLQNLVVFWVGAFLRAFAAGGAGFAFALAASAVWLHVLDPLHTTVMVVASGTLLHGILIWPIRRSIEMARLWPSLPVRHSAFRSASRCCRIRGPTSLAPRSAASWWLTDSML
jgi:hypothetical protein